MRSLALLGAYFWCTKLSIDSRSPFSHIVNVACISLVWFDSVRYSLAWFRFVSFLFFHGCFTRTHTHSTAINLLLLLAAIFVFVNRFLPLPMPLPMFKILAYFYECTQNNMLKCPFCHCKYIFACAFGECFCHIVYFSFEFIFDVFFYAFIIHMHFPKSDAFVRPMRARYSSLIRAPWFLITKRLCDWRALRVIYWHSEVFSHFERLTYFLFCCFFSLSSIFNSLWNSLLWLLMLLLYKKEFLIFTIFANKEKMRYGAVPFIFIVNTDFVAFEYRSYVLCACICVRLDLLFIHCYARTFYTTFIIAVILHQNYRTYTISNTVKEIMVHENGHHNWIKFRYTKHRKGFDCVRLWCNRIMNFL